MLRYLPAIQMRMRQARKYPAAHTLGSLLRLLCLATLRKTQLRMSFRLQLPHMALSRTSAYLMRHLLAT